MIKAQKMVLKEYLDENDYNEIKKLEGLCRAYDHVELKLELDYKMGRATGKTGMLGSVNEFMFYDGDILAGYAGICYFGGEAMEVNGMVHPEHRGKGVFSRLYALVKEEFRRRDIGKMLLLSDADSKSGIGFIKSAAAEYFNSEYEMYLRNSEEDLNKTARIRLRKASNSDAGEIVRQNSIYFGTEVNENDMPLPEEEEKCGMEIFLAELDGKIIGKIHLEQNAEQGAIYGLGVLTEYRSNGYGREILRLGVSRLKQRGASTIKLQVAVKNKNALTLYQSCGFEVASTMDYYQIEREALV